MRKSILIRKAVFLDRDGVLNPMVWNARLKRYDSPHHPEAMRLMPGTTEALDAFARSRYLLFIVSNQPGAAKGWCAMSDLHATHGAFENLLGEGALIQEFYYCYHHPESSVSSLREACSCRKPGNMFLRTAQKKYGLDMNSSWMVGDRDIDVLCGQSMGMKTILIDYPYTQEYRCGAARADFKAADIREAAGLICKAYPALVHADPA